MAEHEQNTEAKNAHESSASELSGLVMCPDCGGDGKETCHNPDHGFLDAIGTLIGHANGCPVCGHSENHKVYNGGDCETCEGRGKVSVDVAMQFCKDMDYDLEEIYYTT